MRRQAHLAPTDLSATDGSAPPHWSRVVVVGPGLIGGSIGLALKRIGAADTIVGVSRRQSTLDDAIEVGAIDVGSRSLGDAVRGADAVIVCTPVGVIARQVVEIAEAFAGEASSGEGGSGVWITDAGSCKASIVREVAAAPLQIPFVGSHPLAGSEQSGPRAAHADLYDDKLVVVTPTEETPVDQLDAVTRFWRSLGARVERMTPEEHDRKLAATSHVPHLMATALAAATDISDLSLAATGWGSTTRIAAGEPELWCDIFLDNRTFILEALAQVEGTLSELRQALIAEDTATINRLLTEGKKRRDSLGS